MRTDGNAIREYEMVGPHLDLEAVKDWAKRTFTRERIAEAAVAASTFVVLGYVWAVLYKGIQTYSISGF